MREKLTRHRNSIIVFSLLILIVNVFNGGGITEFYQGVVYAVTVLGIVMAGFVSIVLYMNQESEKFYLFVDTISIIWVFFFVFYTLVSFILFPARVNGTSMIPNFNDNDVIIVWKLQDEFELGDVVFVNVTEERTNHYLDEYFLKRVIGVPGDRVDYINDQVILNGEVLEETYELNIDERQSADYLFEDLCRIKEEVCEDVIPENYYFVLGDNRTNSKDSRRIGLIHKDDLFGRVIFDVTRFKVW